MQKREAPAARAARACSSTASTVSSGSAFTPVRQRADCEQ